MPATHTYAVLEISPTAYAEIRGKLEAAGYGGQFHDKATGEVIDMHGVAVRAKREIAAAFDGSTGRRKDNATEAG